MTDAYYYSRTINHSMDIQKIWKEVPAPKRGELIRIFGNVLRDNKQAVAELITKESRKTINESVGEVQEAIDMCDFGVGLSRQLHGKMIASERQDHKLREEWNPLGVVGVITAFNFPVAVWAWNHILAIVCGDSVVWKPSPRCTETANFCKQLWDQAVDEFLSTGFEARHTMGDRYKPKELLLILEGHVETAEKMAEDRRIALLSATGSTEMGKSLAPRVAARLGRSIFELGGNNAMVVSDSAKIDVAVQAIVFSALGTSGQRCTSLRRLIIHTNIYDEMMSKLKNAFAQVNIGDPADPNTFMGPLIDQTAVDRMQSVLETLRAQKHTIHGGEDLGNCYVRPALVEVRSTGEYPVEAYQETFAPIVYVNKYITLENAIRKNNVTHHGLSASLFTGSMQEAEYFTSACGVDTGLININTGTSGAEIGGAFGGEKDSGWGREAGSDAWKQYMRQSTVTVNYGGIKLGGKGYVLPLSQGLTPADVQQKNLGLDEE